MKNTYRLYPVMRKDKMRSDGSCPIYLFLRVGGTTVKIPTGKNVMPTEWNSKENTAKSNSTKGVALSGFLNKRISDFNTYMLTEEAMGKEITLQLAQKFFDTTDKYDFYQFWDSQIALWQGDKRYNTLKTYLTAYRILKTIAPKLSFGDLNYSFLEKFEHHLITVRKNSVGGRFTKHKVLRCMINQAIAKGYMKENPYKTFKFKQPKGNRMFLTIEEIEKIMNYNLPEKNNNLQLTKDMFEFSCQTGLRFSDVTDLKYQNVKYNPDRIEITMNKTSKPIVIPLLTKAKEILFRYQNLCIKSKDTKIFPFIANASVNKKLKSLMTLCGIDKYISFHSARHSFASTHIQAGTNLVHLQQLLAHASISDTMIYAKGLQEDLFTSMNNLNNMYQAKQTG
ncbi:tyrosine-type recombinase/integrase [Pedobacter sp. GSP4]|uniref:tyrosine-type recombinase/integrase n=1 Tax=Pedobacter sp. GSP4 TaxID=3453716 RepID=UPI003EEC1B6E